MNNRVFSDKIERNHRSVSDKIEIVLDRKNFGLLEKKFPLLLNFYKKKSNIFR